jgi:hypothetical protein
MWISGAFLAPSTGALNLDGVCFAEIQGLGTGSVQFHMADGSTITKVVAANDTDAQAVLNRLTQAVDPADFI